MGSTTSLAAGAVGGGGNGGPRGGQSVSADWDAPVAPRGTFSALELGEGRREGTSNSLPPLPFPSLRRLT